MFPNRFSISISRIVVFFFAPRPDGPVSRAFPPLYNPCSRINLAPQQVALFYYFLTPGLTDLFQGPVPSPSLCYDLLCLGGIRNPLEGQSTNLSKQRRRAICTNTEKISLKRSTFQLLLNTTFRYLPGTFRTLIFRFHTQSFLLYKKM